MISYPRWKIALVAVVVLIGIFLALPNLFGEENALQLARDRAAVQASDRTGIEELLKSKGVAPSGAFLEQGRLTLRFSSKQDQLKARDLIAEARPNQFTIALSQASRVPEWMRNLGLNPLKLGLDLRGGVYLVYQVDVQGAVKQQLDHREQDFRASLRNARVPYQDVQVDYPTDRVSVLFRDADSFTKGKAAILADNRNLNLTDTMVGGSPALELKLTPQEIKERQDYAVQQNIIILRNRLNSPELAVSEPQVAREGVDRIAIQLPGLQNSAEVKKILGKTATLEFRMVDETNNPLEAAATGRVPLGSKLYYTREKQPVLLKRDVVVTGRSAHRRLVPAEYPGRPGRVGEPRQPRRGENAEEHPGEHRPFDGGGVHRPLAREERAGRRRRPYHRGSHQPRDHPRRIQQQLPDHGRQSDRGPRARAVAARRRSGGAVVARWRSARSARAWARTTSTRASTP